MGYRLLHWGPLIALTIIFVITYFTITCHVQWWPLCTSGALVNFVIFLLWNVLTLYNFFKAAFVGPGHVPFGWQPAVSNEKQYLQYCVFCDGYKVPRSHHCKKCQRCVMKMDHHCPWINNCVGHFNHKLFTAFLFFAPCGCLHALCILLPSIYRAFYRNYYYFYGTGQEPVVVLGLGGLIGSMLSVGLSVGVIIAVGGLLFIQLRSIVKNETGIESWIKDKAEYRDRTEEEGDFVFPYDLGRWRNIRMVLHFRTRPQLDGVWWPVRDGCDQYTLTREQILQKEEKRSRSLEYTIVRPYSGALCPISFGVKTCCCLPCTDEPRISMRVGERIVVTRWKRHWLYGDKTTEKQPSATHTRVIRERGWFPRRCAVEVFSDDSRNGAGGDHVGALLKEREPVSQADDVKKNK